MRLLSLVLLTVILLSVPCEAAPTSNGIVKGVPTASSSSATASLPTVTALPSSTGHRMHKLPSSFSPLQPTTEPSAPGSDKYGWAALTFSGLLLVGMASSLGCYVCSVNTPYFILLFMLLLDILLLIWKPITLF